MDKEQLEDFKNIRKMIKNCICVFAWVRTGDGDGCYLEVKKCNVLHNMKITPHEFDINQFDLRLDNVLYIN